MYNICFFGFWGLNLLPARFCCIHLAEKFENVLRRQPFYSHHSFSGNLKVISLCIILPICAVWTRRDNGANSSMVSLSNWLATLFCHFRLLQGNISARRISRDGAVVRALAFHQCGPGSSPARCHMWVEFVVGSRCSEGFSQGSPVFLPPQKLTLLIPIRPVMN